MKLFYSKPFYLVYYHSDDVGKHVLTLSTTRQFLASGSFQPPRALADVASLVKEHNYKGLYILTCADGRVLPEEIFGLKKGEVNILRNGGGRALESDVFRSLSVMSTIAPIGTFIVLHHTGVFRSLLSTPMSKHITLQTVAGSPLQMKLLERHWPSAFQSMLNKHKTTCMVLSSSEFPAFPLRSVTQMQNFITRVRLTKSANE